MTGQAFLLAMRAVVLETDASFSVVEGVGAASSKAETAPNFQ
jgi:hypothetical protein